jgi:GNAT superfamily N-acetyltransferase
MPASTEIDIVGLQPEHLGPLHRIVAANDPKIPDLMTADVGAWLEAGRPDGEAYFVALSADRPVGMAGYQPDRWGVADIAWLVWLYVDPVWHRCGIATDLFGHAQQILRQAGYRKVYLDVGNAANHGPAIAFHERDGFRREGTLPDYWEDGEDFLIFGKRLRD